MRGPTSSGIPSADAMFLVGLFSHMDALLHMPMEDVLEQISLSEDVRAAILDKAGPGGALLSAVMAYEEAEWELAEKYLAAIGADASSISDVYLDAVTWAGSRMAMHEE
jgi:EAL and modified HD-GYP domain-containing signal transduction protein